MQNSLTTVTQSKQSPISLEESQRLIALEKVIERGKKTFVEVGMALAEIRESRLYKSEFSTFEDYCRGKWGWNRNRAYSLIEAASVANALPENVSHGIQNERQARELSKVEPARRESVVTEAKAKAETENRPMTARDIEVIHKTLPVQIQLKNEPRDRTGCPIPENIYPAWQEADKEVREMVSELWKFKKQFEKWQEESEKPKKFARTNCKSVFADLSNAINAIRQSMPHAVCLKCQGMMPTDCPRCLGLGYVDELFWKHEDQAEKELRARALREEKKS